MNGWRVLAAALVLAVAATAGADVVYLTNGDRISGKVVTAGRKSYVLQTPYGRLNVPRIRIWKVEKPDGSEELLNSPDAAAVPTARLILVVMGSTFWQAWDPKDAAGLDPSLRLRGPPRRGADRVLRRRQAGPERDPEGGRELVLVQPRRRRAGAGRRRHRPAAGGEAGPHRPEDRRAGAAGGRAPPPRLVPGERRQLGGPELEGPGDGREPRHAEGRRCRSSWR